MNSKFCTKCGEEKTLDRFSKYRREYTKKNGEVTVSEGYIGSCKDCVNAKRRTPEGRAKEAKYREENREKLNAYFRNYFKENKEAHNKAVRKWAKNNPESIRATKQRMWEKEDYREKSKLRKREAKKKDPDKAKCAEIKRHALQQGALFVSEVDPAYIRERDGYECYLCRKQISENEIHYDHIEPAYHEGCHHHLNVAMTHGRCNHIKWCRSPFIKKDLKVLMEKFPDIDLGKISDMREQLMIKLEQLGFQETL